MATPIRVRAIPVNILLKILTDLYERGVDFIDFEGEMDEAEDKLGVSFKREYMNPEFAETFDTFDETDLEDNEEPEIEVKKLTDEDLNQIL